MTQELLIAFDVSNGSFSDLDVRNREVRFAPKNGRR